MSINYNYVVDRARLWHDGLPAKPRLLDYGCGGGEIVRVALKSGFDAHGVDLFYDGGASKKRALGSGLWGARIHELICDGRIPFEDESFDVVTANQVFEHIPDFQVPLSEIARVLRPDGIFLNLFPSLMVWREGHCGIAFSHRFSRGSRVRYWYTLSLRLAGFGYHKKGKSVREWTRHKLKWLDTWTAYRSLEDILECFEEGFIVELRDADYILYRVEHHAKFRYLENILRSEPLEPVVRGLARRFAGHVFLLRKRAS